MTKESNHTLNEVEQLKIIRNYQKQLMDMMLDYQAHEHRLYLRTEHFKKRSQNFMDRLHMAGNSPHLFDEKKLDQLAKILERAERFSSAF